MNTSLPPQDRERFPRPGGKRWVPALAFGVLLGAGALALLSRQSETPLWSRWFGALGGRSTRVDVSQPTVVEKIQQLQRLETVVYTMDKVVSGEKENVLPDFLTGDRLLMLVHGEVVAGVDFGTLKSGDVAVSGKQVRLHLPDAQVFSTRLDNARSESVFAADGIAGSGRSEPGEPGAAGGRTAAAAGGAHRRDFEDGAGKRALDDDQPAAGVGLLVGGVLLAPSCPPSVGPRRCAISRAFLLSCPDITSR
jgi:hypothetical protein